MRQTNIFDFLIESFTSNISNIEDTRKQRTNIIYRATCKFNNTQ